MKLYFQPGNGNLRLIKELEPNEEVYPHIKNFCDERGYEIPYIRVWVVDNITTYDVGSHTEFFIVKED